ncbi:MAG TPA: hypothetical protein VM733_06520 [Thermoanaerobaculia bacterium]|nr:hypothetical protein [Thermoanaerobaculia bacterium]
MKRLLLCLAITLPLAAQDNGLFPRFSVTGGYAPADFETNARIDPEIAGGEGTLVGFERDLGLDDQRTLHRLNVQWRPFARHELAATYFSAPRSGLEQITRNITFRDEVYPVDALVSTQFDFDYASLTYTYWARRGSRDGLGISLGVAHLALAAALTYSRPGTSATVTQTADTEAPILLGGLQGRVAFTDRIHGEAAASMLPRVTIEDYTGRAVTAMARLEYRPVRWLGVGAAYQYFNLDIDVAQPALNGSLDMTIRGPEAYLRLAF